MESTAWVYLVTMLPLVFFACCLFEYLSKRSARNRLILKDYKGQQLRPVIRVNVVC